MIAHERIALRCSAYLWGLEVCAFLLITVGANVLYNYRAHNAIWRFRFLRNKVRNIFSDIISIMDCARCFELIKGNAHSSYLNINFKVAELRFVELRAQALPQQGRPLQTRAPHGNYHVTCWQVVEKVVTMGTGHCRSPGLVDWFRRRLRGLLIILTGLCLLVVIKQNNGVCS